MKFKQYAALVSDADGFMPTALFRWQIRKNPRPTAREEAIAAEVIEKSNPRENITGHFPWGPEERMVLQQQWINDAHDGMPLREWRDVPIEKAGELYSTVETEHGDIPVPNAVREPGQVRGDFGERVREVLGDD